jgi:molecular chaperone DnaK (HSP70)
MIGGSSRVPMVEAAVRTLVGEDKIAKNVNADEAAVMGSPFILAFVHRSTTKQMFPLYRCCFIRSWNHSGLPDQGYSSSRYRNIWN